jgi:hypothetical protein
VNRALRAIRKIAVRGRMAPAITLRKSGAATAGCGTRRLSFSVTENGLALRVAAPSLRADQMLFSGKYYLRLLLSIVVIEQHSIRSPSHLQINRFSNAFDLNSTSGGR